MKTKYNKIIEWTITIVLAIPYITLVVLEYLLKAITKIVKAMLAIVRVSIEYMQTLKGELVVELSVKD